MNVLMCVLYLCVLQRQSLGQQASGGPPTVLGKQQDVQPPEEGAPVMVQMPCASLALAWGSRVSFYEVALMGDHRMVSREGAVSTGPGPPAPPAAASGAVPAPTSGAAAVGAGSAGGSALNTATRNLFKASGSDLSVSLQSWF
jgi:hypothetical protein